jgi:hypothetical protein
VLCPIPELALASPADGSAHLPDLRDAAVNVWRDTEGTVCAYGWTREADHWLHVQNVASFRFRRGGDTVTAFAPPPVARELLLDTYRRAVLPLALQATGREVLHASAALTPNGVVAFCAVSETGKSTIAYGFSKRGYPLWADDAVAFTVSGHEVTAHPLPFRVRLRPTAAAYYGAGSPASEDAVCASRSPVPLAVVCVLQRWQEAGEQGAPAVEITRLPPMRAFAAVLAHGYCFDLADAGRKRDMLEAYLQLVNHIPILQVRFRPGLARLPALLDAIEETVRAASRERI